MSVTLSNSRNAPSVDAQAEMSLTTWRVFRSVSGHDYLFGFHNSGQTLRMTTPIVSFDAAAGVVITASGRQYMLSGPPVMDSEILAAMAAYALLCSVVFADDVTTEFWNGGANSLH